MAKYMFTARAIRLRAPRASYVTAAPGAAQPSKKACAAAGGRLESMYFAFGGIDAYVIADLPDNVSGRGLGARRQSEPAVRPRAPSC